MFDTNGNDYKGEIVQERKGNICWRTLSTWMGKQASAQLQGVALDRRGVCVCVWLLVAQLCSTLQPIDCSMPGSSVHGILQASIPEWVATPSSRGSCHPRD